MTEPEFDARRYLEELYHDMPDGTLAAIGPFLKPHYMRRPVEALPYVVDRPDVYARVTPLSRRPESGRGGAADAAALPGVWADVDVNGGPKSNGKVVTDGAPTLDAAIELAHSVLAPTLTVGSGYGLQPYWLLEQPWVLATDDDRERAGALAAGWQRRLRREAAGMGIAQLDSTGDLARVLRVPGSINAKAGKRMPVRLLDDGGPRYTLAQLEQLIDHAPPPPPASGGGEGAARAPQQLLAHYPRLARIAHRDGDPPGDGTGHAWDFQLVCEARRRVKPALSVAEAIDLVAHARGLHGEAKGERADYLQRTVERAFAVTEEPANDPGPAGDSDGDVGAWITQQWRLDPANPIVAGSSRGHGDAASVRLTRGDGSVLRFARLAELFDAAAHVRRVSLVTGAACPVFAKPDAVRVAQAVVKLCAVTERPEDEAWALEDAVDAFVVHAAVLLGELRGDASECWPTLVAVVDHEPEPDRRDVASRSVVVRDGAGRLWVPSEALMRHLRRDVGERIDWGTLNTRMLELDWESVRVDLHEPGVPRPEGRHLNRVFFVDVSRLSMSNTRVYAHREGE